MQSAPGRRLQPILREEVEIAVASLKKGKSAGVVNIPAELVQAGGETMIDVFTEICIRIWRFVVVVGLLFYVHGKHLRSCRDGQLT